MAVTEEDLNRLRGEVDTKVNAINLDVMGALAALSDHADRFNRLENRLDSIDRKVDDGFARLDARLDAHAALLEQRLNAHHELVDRRFLSRVDAVDRRFDAVDLRFDAVDRRFDAVDRRFGRLESKIDNRFGWQTVMMAALGMLTILAEPIRAALGL